MGWSDWLSYFLHIETLFFIGLLVIVVYYAFFSTSKKGFVQQLEDIAGNIMMKSRAHKVEVDEKLIKRKHKIPQKGKHEERCREIFESIFGEEFKTIRPEWLKNPVTNKNLELDGFCPRIKTPSGVGLAFEYDGKQHADYVPAFHTKGENDFLYQSKRDSYKDVRCKNKGVMLIRIPHFVAYDDLERYIKQRLRYKGMGKYLNKSGIYD